MCFLLLNQLTITSYIKRCNITTPPNQLTNRSFIVKLLTNQRFNTIKRLCRNEVMKAHQFLQASLIMNCLTNQELTGAICMLPLEILLAADSFSTDQNKFNIDNKKQSNGPLCPEENFLVGLIRLKCTVAC